MQHDWEEAVQVIESLDAAAVREGFLAAATRDDQWPERRAAEQKVEHSDSPGVYAFAMADETLLYVGSSSITIGSRVWQNHTAAFEESELLLTLPCPARVAALLEILILQGGKLPKYNRQAVR